jgi:excisionase family DNA binding protein
VTELRTPAEVAQWLKVSQRTVRHLTKTRQLRPTYIGRLPRYTVADVEAYIAHRRGRDRVA